MQKGDGVVQKLTSILIVKKIEPCLEFWVGRLGFEKTVEVPHGDELGFVILARTGIEFMLQTEASIDEEVRKDGLPPAMRTEAGGGVLYLEVSDLETIRSRLEGTALLVPYRKTFYGAEELWLREPGGNLIGFAVQA